MACGGALPTKKQVEDVVRGTNFGDLNPAWINGIVDLVQSRLSSSSESTDGSEPPTPSEGPSTPSSELSDPHDWIPRSKPFQATVEDDDSCSVKGSTTRSIDPERPCSNTSRRRPPKLSSAHSTTQQPIYMGKPTHDTVDSASSRPSSDYPTCYPSPPSSSTTSGSPRLRPTVHFSERPPPRLNSRPQSRLEPTVKREPSPELSVVDLQWGRLFTGCGEPTTRLRQVLRGLATYINAEYEPKHSIVIRPEKLHAFYKRCQLDVEIYPFHVVFDCGSRKPMRSLELLYQDLRCEYHLVQGETRDRPYIPALTSDGFVNWMSAFIQANPDTEAKRLDKIMSSQPIEVEGDTLDGKPERLPKQLSRHLFPSKPHERTRQRVASSLMDWVEATGFSLRHPPSWIDAFYSMVYHSLSPKSSNRDHRDDRGQRGVREDGETYIEVIEVPSALSNTSQDGSPRSLQRMGNHEEHIARSSTKVLVEEASKRERDASPRRHHRHRHQHHGDASPRTSRHRQPERESSRYADARDGRRSAASALAPPRHHRGTVTAHSPARSSREESPKASSTRADNYAFFQGRDPGHASFDDYARDLASAPRRAQRSTRHAR
ncbi:hypothetical protein HIM_08659 [Hirsutella minnesotensis 3608]|uniref:DUF7514 domain-containing protein n=1 Tax=Hirsutella minnesotensis 3608 TaxID=1043627 RepID=A0A0F8A3K3_9HYPO|nr:hypothetical protein HIM_08659 [Hirsutella minnesotensis 3608]